MLVEPDARHRMLAHRVRVAVGDGCDGREAERAALDAEIVSTLSGPVIGASVDLTEDVAAALGPVLAEHGARAYPLAIEPPLTPTLQGALIVSPPVAIAPEALRDLTQALSEDRASELAHAAFAGMQAASDPMELTDGQVRVIHVNPAFERFTGYARHEVVGRTLAMLRPQNTNDNTSVRFGEAVLERNDVWFGVVTSAARDGSLHPHEIMVTTYEAASGRFSGNMGVRRALAHRVDREAALVQAHQEFRAVLSELPEPIAVLVGPLVYFGNGALFELLGRPSDEVIAARFDAFLHPEDAARFATSRGPEIMTVRLVRPDGSVRSAELGAAGAISFEGLPAEILVVRDTTQRRIASERDAHASRLSAIGALAASIAHEINNPLSFVLGNLEALSATGTLDRDAIHDAVDGAKRIKKIIRELSTFAHFDDRSSKLEAIEVEPAVKVALGIIANQIRHTTRVEVLYAPDLYVRAEEGPLVQVLVNLFVNASQAMSAGGRTDNLLRITTSSNAELGEILVEDTGPGIPEHVIGRVFEPFFTTRSGRGGSGLGLSVTRDIVQRFGGTIEVSTVQGQGSTFAVRLPRATQQAAVRTPTPTFDDPPRARLSVVVVDDEEAMGRVIRRVLSAETVETFHDPVAAVERLVTGSAPDVVLCDAMMPTLTGPEVFETVIAVRPELADRFLFMTGGTFTGPTAKFLGARADRVLSKPFTPEELRAAVLAVPSERAECPSSPAAAGPNAQPPHI